MNDENELDMCKIDALFHRLHNKKIYIFFYTIVFSMVAFGVFYWFIRAERSLIWHTDGQPQHFNALVYYGHYLRGIGRSLLQGEVDIPLWDFTFGFGADILTTLHYYVIGDPLTLLSMFVPTRYTEQLYHFLIIFRLYLAGIAYSFYAFRMKKEPVPVLIGALIYVFCGFAIVAIRHPFFLNPFIYLPLILLGVEKIFKKEKPYLFIVMICLSLSSSFYFFYMISILLFIYTLIRSFFVYDKFSYRNLVKDVMKFMLYYLIGVLMAGVIAFPNIYALLTSNRMEVSNYIPLFYPWRDYAFFPFAFISDQRTSSWTHMGYAVIAVIAVLYLFLFAKKKKENLQLRIGFVSLTVILMVPYLGHVMHGFSYVTNRWMWGYGLLVSFIVTSMLPELIEMSRKKLIMVSSLVIMYILALIIAPHTEQSISLTLGALLLINLVILFAASLFRVKTQLTYVGFLFVVMLNMAVLGYFHNARSAGDYVSEFQPVGETILNLQQSGTMSVSDWVVENDFFRVEENPFHRYFIYNTVTQTGVYGSSFYWSLANPFVSQFLDEIHHWAHRDFQYVGLDARAMPGALTSTRYFVVRAGHEAFVPYGYEPEPVSSASVFADNNRTYYAFLNAHALPLGFTYRYYMTRSQYDQLSFIERQQALMQAVLLEDRETLGEEIELIFNDQRLAYEVEVSGLVFEDNRIEVFERGATLTLTFEEVTHSELYVNFNRIYFEGQNNRATVSLATDTLRKRFFIGTDTYNFYGGRHHFALNMGYQEEALGEVTITFNQIGVYTFDSIEVIAQPMTLFPEMVANLNAYTLENIMISTNQIEGSIALSEERILVLTIPYSDGWRAYVNDEAVDLIRANTMFMAIELSAGEQHIVLRYRTPFLLESFVMTFGGWACFLGVIIYFRKKKKQQS